MPNIEKYSSWLRLVERQVEYCSLSTCAAGGRASTQQGTSEPGRMKTSPPGSRVTRSALECRGQPVVQNRRRPVAAIRPLPAEYELAAEQLLTKAAQMDSFEEDIKRLMKGHPVEKESRLHGLSVTMDRGMIKLNTRISRVEGVGETTKSPAVLAGEHPYTVCISPGRTSRCITEESKRW
ncbi:hypothetical protein EVAR_90939_1 [Eumeta japonica]|uniref:Uncharacterized protein n=1 Tax=Eumeta variegata TaxID=151549 RepID=A0A4C1SEB9_EUMVA|nr:hypothetical protein EVAR_90939_1 [Eumeta japonica]